MIDGDNRTLAMHQATGDIFIFSDADDLPHPQRVEVTKYFFENFEVDHIIHGLGYDREDMAHFNIENIPVLQFASFQQFIRHVEAHNIHTTLGSPCFLRKIGDRIKWAAINDREYNMEVYRLYPNKIVLPIPLILYRRHLSSHLKRECAIDDVEL